MRNLKQEIIEYFKGRKTEEELFDESMTIAKSIAVYAHRSQFRENKEPYINHPWRVAENYVRLITLPIEDLLIPEDVADSFNIPTLGVFEVSLLHDVIEDTDITMEDIEEIYKCQDLLEPFQKYIKEPLSLLSHNKEEDYDTYISKVLTNNVASIVKMLDMVDNSNALGLKSYSSKELERSQRYLYYIKVINDKYNFLENCYRARNYYQKYYYENRLYESQNN